MVTLVCQDGCFEKVAAILFDKDGTLADSHPYLQQLAIARAHFIEQQVPGITPLLLAAFGCQAGRYDATGLMAVGTRSENEIAAAACVATTGRSWAEALAIAKTAFRQSDPQGPPRKAAVTPPFPGVLAWLKQLHAGGIRLAILSGDTTDHVRDFVEYYGLSDPITWWAGSDRPPRKPDPQMLWAACQQLQVTPQETVVIGDSELDHQLARQGQARAFMSVTWGGSPAIPGADAVLTAPSQLRLVSSGATFSESGDVLR